MLRSCPLFQSLPLLSLTTVVLMALCVAPGHAYAGPGAFDSKPQQANAAVGGGRDTQLPAASSVERYWYGWQILVVDATVLASAAGSGGSALPLVVTTGPVIHALHGEGGKAAVSLGLRAVLPVLGGLAGIGLADCEPQYNELEDGTREASWESFGCGLGALIGGVFLGLVTAEVVDVSVLAWGERELKRPRISGALSVGDDRVNMSLSGSF